MPVCCLALVFVLMGLSGVDSSSVSEKDSIRAIELYNEGNLWLRRGGPDKATRLLNYETARKFYWEAIQINPAYVDPHIGLGWAFLYSDSIEKAIQEFESLKNNRPSHRMAYYGLGRVYMKAKRWKDAERELRMALAVWPYYYLSELSGDRTKALSYTSGDLDYRVAMASLSEALANQGKQKESKFWGDSVVSLKKGDYKAFGTN